MHKKLIFFLAICCIQLSLAQTSTSIDFIKRLLKVTSNPEKKTILLYELSTELLYNDAIGGIEQAEIALKIAKSNHFSQLEAELLNNLGKGYYYKGDQKKALHYQQKALAKAQKLNLKLLTASCKNDIGLIYGDLGEYEKAIELLKETIEIYNDFSSKYLSKSILKEAKSLAFYRNFSIDREFSTAHNNLGTVYSLTNDFNNELYHFKKSLQYAKLANDELSMAYTLGNIGSSYITTNDYKSALYYLGESYKLVTKLNQKQGMVYLLDNMTRINLGNKDYTAAFEKIQRSKKIAIELNQFDLLKNVYDLEADYFMAIHDYKSALSSYQKSVQAKDSILNSESKSVMLEMQTLYETEKKDKKISLLNKDATIKATQLNQQRVVTYSILGGLCLVSALAFFIFRGLKQKQKANELLAVQNAKIEEQKEHITDSINYAKRIQGAILPEKTEIEKWIPNSFVLYRPKDIVSGDFYFLKTLNEDKLDTYEVLIAAADCTGHGVPGAMMSMLCSEKLNEAVVNSSSPAEILQRVNNGIKQTLQQSKTQIDRANDGMDIALCNLVFENQHLKTVRYAGANRPLWLMRKNNYLPIENCSPTLQFVENNKDSSLYEIKATKSAIGGSTAVDHTFEEHVLNVCEGDVIYIFSDGYADQFGEKTGKKLMTKGLRNLLFEIQSLSLEDQQKRLDTFLTEWLGETEPIDDVLVIGIRV